MPLQNTQFGDTNGKILSRIEGKVFRLGERNLDDCFADDAKMSLVRIPKPGHEDLSNEKISAPTDGYQQRHEKSGMKECACRHGYTKHDMEIVEYLKHAFAYHRECCNDDTCHEEHEHGTTRIDRIEKEEVPKDVRSGSLRMYKCNVGMKETIEISKSSCKFVVTKGTFQWQTKEKSEDGIMHRRCKGKDQRCACGMSRNADTRKNKGVYRPCNDACEEG
mmetsp:Transcript_9690/g.22302  ORF Transcript_9690/g.22302 Transcript_9690/m.22302 type:complete len:220 (+) Transcript_9690:1542-2201(+)